MGRSILGNQELLLLHYITENAPLTVAEAAEEFGKAHGLARTTVLTMMERLRNKGRLTREKVDGIYRYHPSVPRAEMLRNLVGDFFHQALGGSLEPFIAFLTQDARLTPEEVQQLRQMAARLDDRRIHDDGDTC